MKFNAIIFDWDGTLCQTLGLWVEGYRLSLKRQGYNLSATEVARDFLHHHAGIEENYQGLDYAILLDDAYDYLCANIHQARLYENAVLTLQELASRDTPIALVSNSARRVMRAGIDHHGVRNMFCSILSGDDVTRIKPDPEPFSTTLQSLGCAPRETLVIGDNRSDILAGKTAGMQTCLYTPHENRTFHNFDDLRRSEPDFEIDDLAQLLNR